ncbi:MAG TPA: hypothetical protein VI670_20170 [Thermoanaerobaculia bacterium]|jgi:hypothetical protein
MDTEFARIVMRGNDGRGDPPRHVSNDQVKTRRHSCENAKKIGREFSVTAIAKTFPASLVALRHRALELHEELIDFGAHFNFGVLDRAFRATGDANDHYSAEIKILIAGERERTFCFTKLAQVGVCALEVLEAGIDGEWDVLKVRAAIGYVTTALRKRPKERLTRRRNAT